MHWPVTLLRCRFGPQPPSADAGATADHKVAEIMTAPSRTDPIDFMEAPSVRRGAASRRAYISRELSGKARRRHAAARQRPLSADIVNNPGIGGDDLNGVACL
jgi:hypothetical protein